jgi:hypothetical protein
MGVVDTFGHAKQYVSLISIIVPLLKENDVTSLPEDPTTKMIKEISSFPFFTSTTKSTTFLSSTSDAVNPVKKLTINGMEEAESSTKVQGGIFYSIILHTVILEYFNLKE